MRRGCGDWGSGVICYSDHLFNQPCFYEFPHRLPTADCPLPTADGPLPASRHASLFTNQSPAFRVEQIIHGQLEIPVVLMVVGSGLEILPLMDAIICKYVAFWFNLNRFNLLKSLPYEKDIDGCCRCCHAVFWIVRSAK